MLAPPDSPAPLEHGETVTAIRQRVHEIETWARDEFVRKGSFETAMSRVEKILGDQFDRIEIRMDRMEKKIDDKLGGGEASI